MVKLGPKLAKARTLSTADLDAAIAASGLTQFELGELVGIEDRAVRRLLDPERKRADRLDLLCALKRLGKERSCDEAIGGKPRTLLVSVEPPNQVRSLHDAHGGPVRKISNSAEASRGGQESATAVLTQGGDNAQPPARSRGARASDADRAHGTASVVRLTGGVAAVAQPGSAPGFNVPEVVRSNRTSGPAKRRAA